MVFAYRITNFIAIHMYIHVQQTRYLVQTDQIYQYFTVPAIEAI